MHDGNRSRDAPEIINILGTAVVVCKHLFIGMDVDALALSTVTTTTHIVHVYSRDKSITITDDRVHRATRLHAKCARCCGNSSAFGHLSVLPLSGCNIVSKRIDVA